MAKSPLTGALLLSYIDIAGSPGLYTGKHNEDFYCRLPSLYTGE